MSETAKQTGGGIGAGMLAILLGWPLVVAVGAGYIIDKRAAANLSAELLARPQIAVVDEVAMVGLALDAGADRYDPRSVARTVGKIVERNGYGDSILLSKSMVLYAPDTAELAVSSDAEAPPVPAAAGAASELK